MEKVEETDEAKKIVQEGRGKLSNKAEKKSKKKKLP